MSGVSGGSTTPGSSSTVFARVEGETCKVLCWYFFGGELRTAAGGSEVSRPALVVRVERPWSDRWYVRGCVFRWQWMVVRVVSGGGM